MRVVPSFILGALVATCSLPAQNQDAALVNGVDGYINVPSHPSLTPTSAMTIEAWVFFNNTGLNPTALFPTIARKNVANGQEEYFLRVEGTGVLRWKVKVSATLSVTVNSPTAMPGGVWTHVAGTYDGTMSRLYINGVQVAQATAIGAPFNGGGALRIGKGDDQGGLPSEVWSGRIDELRLWSVARTASQIQSAMSWEVQAVPGLVSSWRMNGGPADAVGPNGGTVVGSVAFGASTLSLNTGPGPWQINQPEMSFDVDGVASDGFSQAVVARTFTPCAAATMTANLSSALTGAPWDVAVTTGPGVPGNAGGITTANGQAVNIAIGDPSLVFLFGPNPSPPLATSSIPLSFSAPFAASAQAFVITPFHPDGFVLSSLVRPVVTMGASTLPGPTGDDTAVTVSLANPAFCGAPATIPFYGINYSQCDVISNGRVMFGAPAPNTSFTPSVASALSSYPFVGPWCDLAPNLGGSITISVPAPGLFRVDWTNVRYFAAATSATFGIQFDGNTGAITIDGLLGMSAAAVNQFLGISAGTLGPATNAGATTFIAGGPFSVALGTDMIYAFGSAGSLTPGLSAIVLVPSFNGGYDWGAF